MKINFLLIPVFNQSPIKLWRIKLSLFFFSVILLSCSKGSEEDCEGTFKSFYESDFCKNCETFPGREVKINFMEKDTSIFKFDINDSMVFLFQDSSKNQDTVIYVCTYNDTFLGQPLPSAYLSGCINLIEADNQEIIFTPNKPNHGLLKVKLVADYNGGFFKIDFLNSFLDGPLSIFENSNVGPYMDSFIYNSIIYNSVTIFKAKDINNKSVNFYLNIENNFCLISKEDSSFYQRIN